jgi:hypothetical protein
MKGAAQKLLVLVQAARPAGGQPRAAAAAPEPSAVRRG